MTILRENTKAYHVNDEYRCRRFVEDSNYIIESDDTWWLGKGMYFWDNKGNANYWLAEKKRKNSNEKYIRTKSNLYIDEDILLDLTDDEVLNLLMQLWKEYCKREKCKIKQPLGVRLDKLFDFFDEELSELKVIKGTGYYDNKFNNNKFLVFDKRYPNICSGVKNIYCAKSPEMIVNRTIEED
ncbi:hypothetical protein QTH42_15620 [Clostridium perfringens]|nr:hypothetical protein [Clostridium perfringens]